MSIFNPSLKQIQKVVSIPITNIVANRSQPRKEFDESLLYSLSQSIKENGVIQPVCVRKNGAVYEIISGERRVRASKLAGLSEVPCIIMSVDEQKSAILALVENIQRSDLSYFEEAIAINELITCYGLTQQEAAQQLGKAQSTIANKLRLLRFTDAERSMLAGGNISERQARALVRIADDRVRTKVLSEVVSRHLNIEQTEILVNEHISDEKRKVIRSSKSIFNIRIPKIYINSLNHIVRRMKEAKINCSTVTRTSDDYFEYIIKIPVSDFNE